MATKYYIENENGTILSEDGTRKFIVLEGQKLHDYLQTEEGKQKRFFVYEDNGEVIFDWSDAVGWNVVSNQ